MASSWKSRHSSGEMALVTFGEALLMWQVDALPSAVALREIQRLDVSPVLSMFQDFGKMTLPGVQAGS
jgi:hypothetical protein